MVDNNVGNGEITHYESFLLFPTVLFKGLHCTQVKTGVNRFYISLTAAVQICAITLSETITEFRVAGRVSCGRHKIVALILDVATSQTEFSTCILLLRFFCNLDAARAPRDSLGSRFCRSRHVCRRSCC